MATALAIKYLLARYNEILHLRKTQIELRKLKSEEAVAAIESDITQRLESLSDEVTTTLMKEFNKSAKDERSQVNKAVLKLARMIDRRYRVEVRVASEEDFKTASDEADRDDETVSQVATARREILNIQFETRFFEAEKEPVLLIVDAVAD